MRVSDPKCQFSREYSHIYPLILNPAALIFLQIALTLFFIAAFVLWAVYAERKVSAFVQDRMGPMVTGPLGSLQTLADVLKLVLKEQIMPAAADKILFVLAPALVFVAIFGAFSAMPLAPGFAGTQTHTGLLLVLGIAAIDVIALLMAGWGSGNKYALLGSMRAVAQIVSYEIPAALALLSAVMMYGTLDLQALSAAQGIYAEESARLLGIWDMRGVGGLPAWSVICYPHLLLSFVVYFIASLAECNRAPFDIPEAESELVSGFHVEFGGYRFALIMLSEYGKMLLVSLLASVVFLGGWNSLLPNIGSLALADWTTGMPGTFAGFCWGFFWLLTKSLSLVLLQMWIRWTFPRVRVDQLMDICWKVLIPVSLGLLGISGVWKVLESAAYL